jgi:hypothetical protein
VGKGERAKAISDPHRPWMAFRRIQTEHIVQFTLRGICLAVEQRVWIEEVRDESRGCGNNHHH